jgi:hypothetical protein
VSALTPNQWTILEALKDGPRWLRSFHTVKSLVNDLVVKGLLERCRPHLGRGNNMVRLTKAGCAALEIDSASVPARRAKDAAPPPVARRELLPIRADATPATRNICEDFARSIGNGSTAGEAVAALAALHDVQRPAIWKRLRNGGVIPPYAPRQDGGKGRPAGGGVPGYTAVRRRRSQDHREQQEAKPLPPRIDRDPCPRCGVRGDFGCSHSRAQLGTSF